MVGRKSLRFEVGQEIGDLTVIRDLIGSKPHIVLCNCSCGKICEANASALNAGRTKSCGHLKRTVLQRNGFPGGWNKIDLEISSQFGELTVVRDVGAGKWECKCSCGKSCIVNAADLRCGRVKSCGHLRKKPYWGKSKKFEAAHPRTELKVGQEYGEFRIIEDLGNTVWVCECSCGKICVVNGAELINGHVKSCGHLRNKPHPNRIDITGETFGYLVVNKIAGHDKEGRLLWECTCNCGHPLCKGTTVVSGKSLRKGLTKSCGLARSNGKPKKKRKPISEAKRKLVLERDDYTCQACGEPVDTTKRVGVRRPYAIHHKDGDETNDDIDNLITHCLGCHDEAHGRPRRKTKEVRHCASIAINDIGEDLAVRLQALGLNKDNGCIIWTGHQNRGGYGEMSLRLTNGRQINMGVHRAAYLLEHGVIPAGKIVRHTCDEKVCFNPKHLIIGTHHDNMQDAIRRGRLNPANGERSGRTTRTWKEITEIRELYMQGWATPELINKFGIGNRALNQVLQNQTWVVKNPTFKMMPRGEDRKVDAWTKAPEILKRYYEGKSCKQLAKDYHTSDFTISRIIKHARERQAAMGAVMLF